MVVDCFIASNHKRPTLERQTYAFLKAEGFTPRFIDRPEPSRVAECSKRATSDVYVLVEDDVLPAPGAIKAAIDILLQHKDVAKLGLSEGSVMGIYTEIAETMYLTGCAIIRKGEGKTAIASNLVYQRNPDGGGATTL